MTAVVETLELRRSNSPIDDNESNMKTSIQVFGATLLGVSLALAGCSRTEPDVFDKPASQRVLEGVSQVDQILTSATNGWGATYKTSRGFKTDLQFKFLPDHKVTIWSDFSADPITSTYKYTASRGVVLSFDTYGMMSKLSDPTILYDGRGSAEERQKKMGESFGGDLEFEVLSATADSVVMRGMKQMNDSVILKPLASAPTSEGVGEALSTLVNFTNYLMAGSGYRYRTVEVDGERVGEFHFQGPIGDLVSANYDKASIVIVSPDGAEETYAVSPTDNGFKTTTPIKIKDKEYSSFERDDAKSPFHAVEDHSVVLNINGNYPAKIRPLPTLNKWYWGKNDWTWGPAVDDIIAAAGTFLGTKVKEVGLGLYKNGVRTLYVWPNAQGERLDIECKLTQVDGNIYRLDLTDWQRENLPGGALEEGTGIHEMIKYFTTYFDETTYVSFVPWGNGGGVTMYSGLDSHYLLDMSNN